MSSTRIPPLEIGSERLCCVSWVRFTRLHSRLSGGLGSRAGASSIEDHMVRWRLPSGQFRIIAARAVFLRSGCLSWSIHTRMSTLPDA